MSQIPEQWQPIVELLKDRRWRINNLYAIEDKDGKKKKFKMNWAQELLFTNFHYLNYILKVRQLGVSTFCALLMLDTAIFKSHKTCGIIDKTDEDAKRKLAKVSFAWDHLDDPDFEDTFMVGKFLKEVVGIRLLVDNKKEMEWNNGSKIWAGVTMRGSSVNFLHVTELGYIASNHPNKAEEISAGSFNTVSPGNIIVVETTHEGGRFGVSYELCRSAMANVGKQLTPMDWKFFFLPWHKEPEYRQPLMEGEKLYVPGKLQEYFRMLQEDFGIKLEDDQKNWYVKKHATPGIDMARQYPSYAEEALQSLTDGSIYGSEMAQLRSQGRVKPLHADPYAQLMSFWDLGQSDYCCVWTMQFLAGEIQVLDYVSMEGATPAMIAGALVKQENFYRVSFKAHFVPHDANNRMLSGKTYVDLLRECGLVNIKVVPRTNDIWIGINHARSLLGRCYFNSKTCEVEAKSATGRIIPSGLGCLEGYRKAPLGVAGTVREMPVHDHSSHGADAFRTMAEAHLKKMIEASSASIPRLADDRKSMVVRSVRTGSIFPTSVSVVRE